MPDETYIYEPSERPFLPGGPHTPRHSPLRRAGYVGSAIICGIGASLGNALVSVNTAAMAGAYQVDAANSGWLIAAYVTPAVCANLFLVRARQEFGILPVSQSLLIAYVLATVLQCLMPSFGMAILTRIVCGLGSSGLLSLTVYNLLQVFPPENRPVGLVLGFGIPQLGIPLARLIPVDILTYGAGRGLSVLELAVGLIALVAVTLHPIPPTIIRKAIKPLDFITFALFAPATTLFCCVLAEGRLLWWGDTPWIGWALVAAIPLAFAAICIEAYRPTPLLNLKWLTAGDSIRFGVVALVIRSALAEQTFGAVGLLSAGNLTNEQLTWLFACVLAAMIAGSALSVFLLHPKALPIAVCAAALLIMAGALMDSQSNNLTRPSQLFLSQSLIGFGAALFVGPALIFGFRRMVQHGPEAFISFLVLFGITQNIGALLGASALGSYQVIRARAHWLDLSSRLIAGDPQVASRTNLPAILTRESNISAFNDVFLVVAAVAALAALFMVGRIFQQWYQARPREATT